MTGKTDCCFFCGQQFQFAEIFYSQFMVPEKTFFTPDKYDKT